MDLKEWCGYAVGCEYVDGRQKDIRDGGWIHVNERENGQWWWKEDGRG